MCGGVGVGYSQPQQPHDGYSAHLMREGGPEFRHSLGHPVKCSHSPVRGHDNKTIILCDITLFYTNLFGSQFMGY